MNRVNCKSGFKIVLFFIFIAIFDKSYSQKSGNSLHSPLMDSILSANYTSYKTIGIPEIVSFEYGSNDQNLLMIQKYRYNKHRRYLISFWLLKEQSLHYLDTCILNIKKYNFLFLDKDNYPEIMFVSEQNFPEESLVIFSIFGHFNTMPKLLFSCRNISRKYQKNELTALDEGTLLKSKNLISFPDLNNDGILDMEIKTIKQLYLPRECSCDNGVMNKKIVSKYLFINGVFQIIEED